MLLKAIKVILCLIFIYLLGGTLSVFLIEPLSPWRLKDANDFTQVSTPDAILGLLVTTILVLLVIKLAARQNHGPKSK
jgi:hypothetical protein